MHTIKLLTRFLPLSLLIFLFCYCSAGYQNAADYEEDLAGDEDVFAALFGDTEEETQPERTTAAPQQPATEPDEIIQELEPLYGPPPGEAAQQQTQPPATTPPATRTLPASDSVVLLQEDKDKSDNRITLSFQLPPNIQVYRETYPNLKFYLERNADREKIDITIEPANPDVKFSFVPFSQFGFSPKNYQLPGDDLSIGSVYFYFYDNNNLVLRYQYQYLFYDVKDAVRGFVEQYFASRLKTITFDVEDIDTHYPLQNANVHINGRPPSPLRLLLKHFTSLTLLDYSLSLVPDYVKDTSANLTTLSGTSFLLYSPESYSVKISHPDYYYFTEQIKVDPNVEGYRVRLSKSHNNNMVKALPKNESFNHSKLTVISDR